MADSDQRTPDALRVTVNFDAETGHWWAESEDVTGLVTAADSYPALATAAQRLPPKY